MLATTAPRAVPGPGDATAGRKAVERKKAPAPSSETPAPSSEAPAPKKPSRSRAERERRRRAAAAAAAGEAAANATLPVTAVLTDAAPARVSASRAASKGATTTAETEAAAGTPAANPTPNPYTSPRDARAGRKDAAAARTRQPRAPRGPRAASNVSDASALSAVSAAATLHVAEDADDAAAPPAAETEAPQVPADCSTVPTMPPFDAAAMCAHLHSCFETSKFCDVRLAVSGVIADVAGVMAHRLVLSQNAVLAPLLTTLLPEAPVVTLPEPTAAVTREGVRLATGVLYGPAGLDALEAAVAAATDAFGDSADLAVLPDGALCALPRAAELVASVLTAAQLLGLDGLADALFARLLAMAQTPRHVAAFVHRLLGPQTFNPPLLAPRGRHALRMDEALREFLPRGLVAAVTGGHGNDTAAFPAAGTPEYDTLVAVLVHLPFEVLKPLLEDAQLPCRSAVERFQLAKAVVARRAALGHAVRPLLVPCEETVLLAFTGAENGINVVRRPPRAAGLGPAATLRLHHPDAAREEPALPHEMAQKPAARFSEAPAATPWDALAVKPYDQLLASVNGMSLQPEAMYNHFFRMSAPPAAAPGLEHAANARPGRHMSLVGPAGASYALPPPPHMSHPAHVHALAHGLAVPAGPPPHIPAPMQLNPGLAGSLASGGVYHSGASAPGLFDLGPSGNVSDGSSSVGSS